MIAGVAAAVEPPLPLGWGVERFAGQLPVEQVHLFLFVVVALNAEVAVLVADALLRTDSADLKTIRD